jgi:hypothetical protein
MDLMAADRLGSALQTAALSVLKRGRHRRSRWMKLEVTGNDTAAMTAGRAPRCVCCAGVIGILPDQDMSLGLNVALGLVSDECALICDSCTSQLIAAREASRPPARRRYQGMSVRKPVVVRSWPQPPNRSGMLSRSLPERFLLKLDPPGQAGFFQDTVARR